MKFFVNKKLEKNNSIFQKKSKIALLKSTTALSCLVGSLLFIQNESAGLTTTGTFVASTTIAKSCTISAGSMAFDPYIGSTITSTSAVIADCTTGTTYTISLADTAASGKYILQNITTNIVNTANQLEVTFAVGATALTEGVTAFTGTGTGTTATAGTITGTIAGAQTGKTAGTYNKTMTLNIVY